MQFIIPASFIPQSKDAFNIPKFTKWFIYGMFGLLDTYNDFN